MMEDAYDFIEQHPTIKGLTLTISNGVSSFSSNTNVSHNSMIDVDDVFRLVSSFKLL